MYMYRFGRKTLSFEVLAFSILLVSPPQLVAYFYKSPQRSTNSVWRTLLNKTVRLGSGFCWTRMIERGLFSRVSIRIEGWYLSRACTYPTASVLKSCSKPACGQQASGVLVGESTNTKSHSLDSTWANENFVLSRHFCSKFSSSMFLKASWAK